MKDWGPHKATESVTENIPLVLIAPDRLKMLASRANLTYRDIRCYKPYLKQEHRLQKALPLQPVQNRTRDLATGLLEEWLLNDRIRLIAFPCFFLLKNDPPLKIQMIL